jgi:beta-glucosidase
MSYAKSWEQDPTHDSYYPMPATPLQVDYKEGLYLGYRYYTSQYQQPLFPFGFGLTYTQFAFSNLAVTPTPGGGKYDYLVTFDLKNVGARAGAQVAEMYIGDPSATVKRPVMELKGFRKVRLAPGETAHIELHLDQRSLAYWDTASHGWKVDPGEFIVQIGSSSADEALMAKFNVQ